MFPVAVGQVRAAAIPVHVQEGATMPPLETRVPEDHCLLALSPSANAPLPDHVLIQVLSPQKDSNSKPARSKTLAPAPPEGNTEGSSESSEEELPLTQVRHAFSLQSLQGQSWAGRRCGRGQVFPIGKNLVIFKQHLTASRALSSIVTFI